jgi:hypothetical protein
MEIKGISSIMTSTSAVNIGNIIFNSSLHHSYVVFAKCILDVYVTNIISF